MATFLEFPREKQNTAPDVLASMQDHCPLYIWRSCDSIYQEWVHEGSKNKDLMNINLASMALRIGLLRSSALQHEGLDAPVILQCRTPQETNPKGNCGPNCVFFLLVPILGIPSYTMSRVCVSFRPLNLLRRLLVVMLFVRTTSCALRSVCLCVFVSSVSWGFVVCVAYV